jgi:hypothetical protein
LAINTERKVRSARIIFPNRQKYLYYLVSESDSLTLHCLCILNLIQREAGMSDLGLLKNV